ncbi:hypothetical protein Cflav_PD0309 [Pedosphaera parvula Ellin514]|uniref:Uncharacterized protein n=1 Tax=Pedosphaera parvula (strain Ellin514) TaxID=320771 RepID=B9XSG2_PEDPL|nr:hypothetical protein Cflav_PD0309 [Pedosphaera parvula Ellin514]
MYKLLNQNRQLYNIQKFSMGSPYDNLTVVHSDGFCNA